MLTYLLRQKRRIIFAGVAGMLAHALLFGPGPGAIGTGVLMAVIGLFIIALAPSYRGMAECLSLGLVIAALLPLPAQIFPGTAIVCILAAHAALHGSWTDRLPLRLGLVSTRKSLVNLPAVQVWNAVIPGESHPEDHWTGRLVDFDKDADDAETIYLRFARPDDTPEEMTLTFLERVPHKRARYLLERVDPTGADDVMMTICLNEPELGRCEVDTRLEQEAMPIRLAFEHWFDDCFGDELHNFATQLQRNHRWTVVPTQALTGKPA